MKRHLALQPLSREHHLGLVIATKAKNCSDDDRMHHWQALNDYLAVAIPAHFKVEHVNIANVILHRANNTQTTQLVVKMLRQHDEIQRLLTNDNPSVQDVKDLANALYEHIRFEERELFPIAERMLSVDELQAIYDASDDKAKRADEGR